MSTYQERQEAAEERADYIFERERDERALEEVKRRKLAEFGESILALLREPGVMHGGLVSRTTYFADGALARAIVLGLVKETP